ncbi:hypothetical protein TESG_05990 [Trichophyton tonsurans CBS 112818]|uniref:Guanylate kinase-like domain-containing protein n=1 Tax=Trichophyton tonsurans (strain CBS 112818) TaxID=647933 RepID=F2S564_TRIT1|nr:hypothetical protein TESG_05990 [Trichophyton tonsurans CBS 112818]
MSHSKFLLASQVVDPRPIIISGPSGVGKGSLCQRLVTSYSGTVSHATRGPRPGEVEGVAYHFTNDDAFSALASQDGLECLETRLRRRGTEVEENIPHRLAHYTIEFGYADIPGIFDKVVVNDELHKAYDELVQFVRGS